MDNNSKMFNLVIGLSGPYGSGCSSLAEELFRIFNDWPGCKAIKIPVSKLIELWSKDLTGIEVPHFSCDNERRDNLQKAGTAIRKKHPELIGKIIANEIHNQCCEIEKLNTSGKIKTIVSIVDSLKNYNDFASLKSIYKDEFFFCFINANNETRWRRMRDYKSWQEKEKAKFMELDSIDSDEKDIRPEVADSGQQVKKLAGSADYYFINNSTRENLRSNVYRFACLIFGFGINQPLRDEKCMHLAFSSANSSACLSRQVGAAIFTPEGNILSIGHNDVPKSHGGLYTAEDDEDHRCLNVGDRRCINDTNKDERFQSITERLHNDLKRYFLSNSDDFSEEQANALKSFFSSVKSDSVKELIDNVIRKSQFKDATEYCRAVHAEMEALISVCRNLSGSTIGTTVYVTTQPCHNCTKHLICAGVKEVIYIEPYPKSLGEELHSDAINLNPQGATNCGSKIQFIPYQGVAPRKYHEIFDMDEDRKDESGIMVYFDKLYRATHPKFCKKVQCRLRLSEKIDDPISLNEIVALEEIEEHRIKEEEPNETK